MYSEEIKLMYKKADRMTFKVVIVSILAYIISICIVSVFLGTPFPHKVVVAFVEVYVSGWIDTHMQYLILCGILAILVGWIYMAFALIKLLRGIDSILLKDCDCKKYLEIVKSGIQYGKDNKLKRYSKVLRTFLQERCTLALIANWELDAAKKFMEEEWIGKKTTISYRNCKMNLELVSAFVQEDVTWYLEVYNHAPIIFRNNKIFRSYALVLQDKVDEAIQLLAGSTEKNANAEVIRHFRLGKCYIKTGDMISAKEHMKYVIENGNTLPVKKIAEEWYNENL